jgi:hypothetical protein
MRAEDPSVDVSFIDDHISQTPKESRPSGVIGKEAKMKHVRIGEDKASFLPYPRSIFPRRIAIEAGTPHGTPRGGKESLKGCELILRQGLSGEEIERSGAPIRQNRLDHGNVVAQGLSAGSRGRYDDIPSLANSFRRRRLMTEEGKEAEFLQPALQSGQKRSGQSPVSCRSRMQVLIPYNLLLVELGLPKVMEEARSIHGSSEGQNLSLRIDDVDIESAPFDELDDFGQYLISLGMTVGRTDDTQGSHLPQLLVLNFSDGHVVAVPHPGDNGFDDPALLFQGMRLCQVQPYLAYAHLHHL